jgi:hypothetical protein
MELISQTAVEGRAGPTFGTRYPTLEGVDLTDIASFTNGQPYDGFARRRAEAPVMWHPETRMDGPGFWAVTRHEDVMAVNGDPATFSSQRGGILMAAGRPEARHALLHRHGIAGRACAATTTTDERRFDLITARCMHIREGDAGEHRKAGGGLGGSFQKVTTGGVFDDG